ncbi:hypothetical protein BU17DRAFT_72228 [Hysterangium stoloniferum]|nr:hypothetical protein BU17DRAFT_72228 [Hysterangium stoloniferum]
MTYLTLSPVPTNTHRADPLYRFNATVTSSCHWPPEAEAQPKCSKHAPNHDTDTEMSTGVCMSGYYGTPYSSCDSSLRFVNLTLDWLKWEWAGKVDFISADLNVAGALIMKGRLLFIQCGTIGMLPTNQNCSGLQDGEISVFVVNYGGNMTCHYF